MNEREPDADELVCCYCGEPQNDRLGCCGENHWVTYAEWLEEEQ